MNSEKYIQTFNEGYSKACFDIGYNQGHNSGYQAGYQAGLNQEYWNSVNNDTCVQTNFQEQTYQEQTHQEQPHQEHENPEEIDEEPVTNDFDDNMEIDFEWYSQDNECEAEAIYTPYTPLYGNGSTSSTIWNVIKTDINETEESPNTHTLSDSFYKNIDISNIFNTYEPISWNVIKEESKHIVETSENPFNTPLENPFNTPLENPFDTPLENHSTNNYNMFTDFNLDSNIFSSFSWGDLVTPNLDVSFENDTHIYEPIPSEEILFTPTSGVKYHELLDIQEYTDYDEEDDATIDSDISEETSSWICISEKNDKLDEVLEESTQTDIDSYSFNFGSVTSDDSVTLDDTQSKTQPENEYDYTTTVCDEISLDSSFSSDSMIEEEMNAVSFSMPSLQISFDDLNIVRYYDDVQSVPARRLPPNCAPLSPIRRVPPKKNVANMI
jgi:hypothetical protein